MTSMKAIKPLSPGLCHYPRKYTVTCRGLHVTGVIRFVPELLLWIQVTLCISCFRHPCVGPVCFTHAPIISLTSAFYPRTFFQFNLTHLLLVQPVRFTLAPIASLTCAFYARTYYWFSPCVLDARTYY